MRTSRKLIAMVRAGFVLLIAVVAGPSVRAVVQIVTGAVPAAVAQLQPTGSLPVTTNLNLAIGLPLRNQAALSTLLQQLYDPTSPKYRHYLTPAQFTAQFGPTVHDYQALINFVKANGLTVTSQHPNRVLLDVQGSVANIEKAFHLTMRVYQHPTDARLFYAPDVDPSLNLAVPVLTISGLNNYSMPHSQLHREPSGRAKNATPNAGSGPGGTYMGYDFRNAYFPGVTAPTGVGQVVGLVEFDGYYPNDITAYEQESGLPRVPLINVLLDGFNGVPTIGSNSANDEVALDIDMAISMAPGLAKVIVYEAGPYGIANDILSQMASDNQAKQLSCSWSWGGGPDATADQLFQQMAAQGQSFFTASGDFDAITGSTAGIFPCDDPYLTSVGATTLTTAGLGGRWMSETVWNLGTPNPNGGDWGSSGGISTSYPIPSWQKWIDMSANQGSATMRNFPDVAMVGDNIGIIADNGQQVTVGGTSCAAPLWAGLIALANQQAMAHGHGTVGFINPAIYALGDTPDFHDITTGNNFTSNSPTQFAAVAGYDLCTGWGTPAGSNTLNDLTGTVLSQFDITRTALYWFTHGYTNDPTCATLEQAIAVNGGILNLGFMSLPVQNENGDNVLDALDTFMEALGFYYKGSGTAGDGSTASALCQARKKLAPELIAAIANNVLLGTAPVNANYNNGGVLTNFPSDLINQATQASAGSDVGQIQLLTALLRKFNTSGVTNNFRPGLVECSPNPTAFLRQITRDPTSYYNCPGLNDSCATAENVVFPTSNNPFAPAKFVRAGLDTRKYAGNNVFWDISPPTGSSGRQFTVRTIGSNFSPLLTVLTGQCTVIVTNGISTIGSNNLTVITSVVATNGFARPQVSFTTDGVSTFFIEAGGAAGKLNVTITSP